LDNADDMLLIIPEIAPILYEKQSGDGQMDGQTDEGEVIPICRHYSVEATQKWGYACDRSRTVFL
jgi:hypothetical protein